MASMNYCDQLRSTMQECGLAVSPVVKHGDRAALRYDAIDITEAGVTFLWLGKPVYMVKRNQDNLVHVNGEMVLELH